MVNSLSFVVTRGQLVVTCGHSWSLVVTRSTLVSIYQTDMTSFSQPKNFENEPNPDPNPNHKPNPN